LLIDAGSSWALCGVRAVLVDADTVPQWSAGGGGHCIGSDYCQRGRVRGTRAHWRIEGSHGFARVRVHATRYVRDCSSAARPATPAGYHSARYNNLMLLQSRKEILEERVVNPAALRVILHS